jgi:glycosyltransferase involved in cell wall biosynthesis
MQKNKILLVSHGPNSTGWGTVTKSIISALSTEFDLVCRTVKLGNAEFPAWYANYETKSLDGVTHVLQYVLPEYYTRYPNVVNVGITEIEYSNMHFNHWLDYYELMDQVWVSNKHAKLELAKFITIPIHVVQHPYKPPDTYVQPLRIPEIDGNYIFYTIAENIPRKNLSAIIEAYHLEFDPSEPVSLVLKSDRTIGDLCISVKRRLQLYKSVEDYSPEVVFQEKISDLDILGLHKLGDCYINTSIGESYGVPVRDAIEFGNNVIVNCVGGLDGEHPSLPNYKRPAGGGAVGYLENARNEAKYPCIYNLMSKMRKAYEGKLVKSTQQFNDYKKYCEEVKVKLNK